MMTGTTSKGGVSEVHLKSGSVTVNKKHKLK